MRVAQNILLVALCCQATTALVTPTRQHAIASPSVMTPRTRLSSDAVGEVSRGGDQQGGGTATIPNEVFNLIKSIVGAGVLSLPAGKRF